MNIYLVLYIRRIITDETGNCQIFFILVYYIKKYLICQDEFEYILKNL
jgi:hypothetical protein